MALIYRPQRTWSALALHFPDNGAVLCWFWVPADRLDDREDKDRVPYRTWRDQGFIETTAGRAIDRRAIALRLAEIAGMFEIRGIGYDRWRMEDLKKILDDEGIEVNLIPWGQGFKDMSPAVEALETLILDGRLSHGMHPVLTWCCSNCVIQTDPAGSRKLDKEKSRERIDGMVSLVMAVGLASREPEPLIYDFDRPMVLNF